MLLFVLSLVLTKSAFAQAQDKPTQPPLPSVEVTSTSGHEDDQKLDEVIEEAKKALESPQTIQGDKPKEGLPQTSGHAIVTIGSSKQKPIAVHSVMNSTPKPKVKKEIIAKAKTSTKVVDGKPKKSANMKPPTGSTGPLSAFELGRYQYCGEDRDCVFAVNGCCDCANGGEDVAVNKERMEAFRARFACLYVSCGEKMREPSCGSGIVSCVNHKCRYYNDAAVDQAF